MSNIARCETNDMYLSNNGLRAVKEIHDTVKFANMLSYVTASIPIFDIFINPSKAHEKIIASADYDWQEFARVMSSIERTNRRKVWNIAVNARLKSSGEEYEFWKCVQDATR